MERYCEVFASPLYVVNEGGDPCKMNFFSPIPNPHLQKNFSNGGVEIACLSEGWHSSI